MLKNIKLFHFTAVIMKYCPKHGVMWMSPKIPLLELLRETPIGVSGQQFLERS